MPDALTLWRLPAWLKTLARYLPLAAMLSGCGGATTPLPLAQVDMSRMYGGWYILATLPNSFEKGMVGPYDVYSARPDGDVQEDFYFRQGSFDAKVSHAQVHDWVRPGTGNAHWRVQILWPIDLPFLILYTDPDYRYVLFGEDNRALGWVYSRTPTLSDADYLEAMAHFKAAGYDISQFRKFIQKPEQIGQPGFWSDGITPGGAQ